MRKLRITHVARFYFFWKALVQRKGSEAVEGRGRRVEDVNTTGSSGAGAGRPRERTGWPLRSQGRLGALAF